MRVSVLIPWRAGCPYRERALAWVTDRYAAEHPHWSVVVGSDTGAGGWVKARALPDAGGADIVVVADADVWCDGLGAAVAAVAGGRPWAVPHTRVNRLTEMATAALLNGAALDDTLPLVQQHVGLIGGGLVVLAGDVHNDVPLDPRFEGWGGEDTAYGYALRALHGNPWRGHAHLWHLWHPPQDRIGRGGMASRNDWLRRKYRRVREDREAMRRLVEEAKWPTCESG